MTDPVRFPAQCPYDKWPDASRVYELLIANADDPIRNPLEDVRTYFLAHRQNITDSIGAVNYWRAQVQPESYPTQLVTEGGMQAWLIPGQAPKPHTFAANVLYLWKADGNGNGSGSLVADFFMGGYAFTAEVDDNGQPIIPPTVPKSAIIGINKGTAWPIPATTNQYVGFINLGDAQSDGRVDMRTL